MAELKFSDLRKRIEAKQFSPMYGLHGEEPYYIDVIAELIEKHCLSESEKSFNQHILYGRDTDAKTLLDVCMRYPMMAERQLVILREAQMMRDLEDIQPYLDKPAPTTVLVVCYRGKKLDGRKKFTKLFDERGTSFYSAPVRDYQMPEWIEGYVRSKGKTIEKRSAILLEEYLGNNLSRVANSIDLLIMNMKEGDTINADLIQKFIGISKDYNSFELNNALLKKDRAKAFRVVNYFASNPKAAHLVMVMGGLYSLFSKLLLMTAVKSKSDGELAKLLGVGPYFVKNYKAATRLYSPVKLREVISLLHRYDVRSKGVDDAGTPHGELLRELIWQILN